MTKLFDDFPKVTSKEWKQKIQFDLKGLDYNQTLNWQSLEGIMVKPFYHSDDAASYLNSNTRATNWSIGQSIYVSNEKQANKQAQECVNKGVEHIHFILPNTDNSLKELLYNLDGSRITISFQPLVLSEACIQNFDNIGELRNSRLHLDPIGQLARSGNWFNNLSEDQNQVAKAKNTLKNFESVISVDMSLYQNAGANIIQQLAYGLAHANEYLQWYNDEKNVDLNFNIATGSNYFFEIAKNRALQLLWATLRSEYSNQPNMIISATPSKRNKTLYDYNTNMLRTTTECMSAVLGGAQIIYNLPYDAIYHKENEFGNRIARNQLLILKHESFFDVVDNPVDGAYYIEELTASLAEQALTLFKDIEKNGGFLNQLKAGTIQRKIKESAAKEQERFDSGDITLVGTNAHPNNADKMNDNLELYPFIKINKRKTLIEPIIERRLSESLEKERLKNENE